jgi:uncharacterized protein YgiM (DUF1202 family)
MARSIVLLFSVAALLLSSCGSSDAAIATGIAETQQISDLQTAAAGGNATDTPQPTDTTAPTTSSGVTEQSSQVTTKQDVNMRAGDGTAYGVMTVIPGGEVLTITGINAAGTWYRVEYHNATGWVSVDFTNGTKPANLPVVTPSAQPLATATRTPSGGNVDYEDYVLTLDFSDDQNHSVSGEVSKDTPARLTIIVEGIGGSQDGEVDIAFQCDSDFDSDDYHISAAGADDNTICNNNWSHQVTHDHNTITVFVTFDGNSVAEWTLIANVSPN